MRTLFIFTLTILSLNIQAQIELDRIGQTPGGAGYHVNYDSTSQRLFVGAGTSLWVYDMSDINNPVVIGKRPFLGLITETILYDQNTLFVSATFDGVYAIDLSSEDLTVIAHENVDGIFAKRAAYDMTLVGDTLLIPNRVSVSRLKYSPGGFTVLSDISVGAFCIAERGNYIAMGILGGLIPWLPPGKVRIYDKSNLSPNAYIAEWSDSTISAISKIRFSDTNDSIIYVCGGSNNSGFTSHFYALKFDGSNITELNSYDITGIPIFAAANIQNMDMRNDTLYLATGCAEDTAKGFPLSYIPVLDATDLSSNNLHEIDYINAGLWHFDVSLIDGTPYMATASEWLGVVINNVTSGTPLDTLLSLPTGGWTQKSKVRGDTLWVAHEGWGLAAYNIDSLMFSNGYMTDSKIFHLYNLTTDSTVHKFVGDFEFLNDTLLLISNGDVYNIKAWQQGTGVADSVYHLVDCSGYLHSVFTNNGQRVIVGKETVLHTNQQLSICDPYNQTGTSLNTIVTLNNPKGIAIKQDTIFYGSKLDTSSSTTVFLVAAKIENDLFVPIDSIEAGTGQINSISVENNVIAIGKGNTIIFYNWDGSHFTYVDSLFDINMLEIDIEIKNHYLYIADKADGVIIIDINSPTSPVAIFEGRGMWKTLFGSTDIEVADDGKIYLSDFNAGVIIIEAFDTTLSSVKENTVDNNIKVYPNPAINKISIELNNDNIKNWNISLSNIKGQIILEKRNISSRAITISTKELNTGIYILNIFSANFSENKKIIIE